MLAKPMAAGQSSASILELVFLQGLGFEVDRRVLVQQVGSSV